MTAAEGHRVLIIEDNPEDAQTLAAFVRSRGDRPFVATCVRQALEMLPKVKPCYILADHQLPMEDGDDAFEESGEYLLREMRKSDMRLVPGTLDTVLQIFAVTSLPPGANFVARTMHLGASHFQSKPLGRDQLRELSGKIDDRLERARRVHHADCAAYESAAAAPERDLGVGPRLVIDGTRKGPRMVVTLDGKPCELTETPLVSLVLAVGVHLRSRGAYSPRESLRIRPGNSAIDRIRGPFKPAVPAGFHVIETDGQRNCRLNPAIVVGSVDWGMLAEHTNVHVRKLAKEMLERRE